MTPWPRHHHHRPTAGLSTPTYDSLGRPIQSQQAIGAEQSINPVRLQRRRQPDQVTDPRSLETATANRPGTVTAQTSPDTGVAGVTFDAMGKATEQYRC